MSIKDKLGRGPGRFGVGGDGRTTDAIHTDATRVGSWEKFTVSCGH
jgi:hypothetical protein